MTLHFMTVMAAMCPLAPGASTLLNPARCVASSCDRFQPGLFSAAVYCLGILFADRTEGGGELELAVIDCPVVRLAVGGETR